YFFEFDGESDRVVFVDDRQSHVEIGGEDEIRFHEGAGLTPSAVESINTFHMRQQVVTGKVVLKDYNYRTPQTTLLVESQINGDMPGELYEYGNHFKDTSEGDTLARIRNEEIECVRRVIEGAGTCMGFRTGFLFTLDDHFRNDLNEQDYLITEVSHEGSQRRALSMELGLAAADTRERVYGNRFKCIPATVQFRPERTSPRPKVNGVMTAVVESAGGDYAYLDEEGRYRARMFFDLGDAGSAEASRPIRMSQPHSGPDYGMHFPHHADTEMVWACVDGDVDRPIALGTVPNPSQKSPSVDQNRMQNVIRTKAGNQIVLDDTIDEAQVLVNTPDAHTVLLDDKDDKVEILTTGKHKVLLDDKNGCIRIQSTSGHFVLMQDDDGGGKITVQSKDGHWIGINDADQVLTVSDESGENTFIVDVANSKLVIRTDNGHIDMHAPNGTIDIQANELKVDVAGEAKVSTGADYTVDAGGNHKISAAANLELDAGMDLKQSAGMNVSSEAGLNHESKGGVMIKAEGVNAEFKGSAMATFQGGGTAFLKGGI
ncbi:MAG: type VI secretion system Vgr family protein, partial [Rhodothermales bacterium]|nr:type VI secretion system Vgr family protein [Rhodothermales bacterium]